MAANCSLKCNVVSGEASSGSGELFLKQLAKTEKQP
jgi:hypothetical protein